MKRMRKRAVEAAVFRPLVRAEALTRGQATPMMGMMMPIAAGGTTTSIRMMTPQGRRLRRERGEVCWSLRRKGSDRSARKSIVIAVLASRNTKRKRTKEFLFASSVPDKRVLCLFFSSCCLGCVDNGSFFKKLAQLFTDFVLHFRNGCVALPAKTSHKKIGRTQTIKESAFSSFSQSGSFFPVVKRVLFLPNPLESSESSLCTSLWVLLFLCLAFSTLSLTNIACSFVALLFPRPLFDVISYFYAKLTPRTQKAN